MSIRKCFCYQKNWLSSNVTSSWKWHWRNSLFLPTPMNIFNYAATSNCCCLPNNSKKMWVLLPIPGHNLYKSQHLTIFQIRNRPHFTGAVFLSVVVDIQNQIIGFLFKADQRYPMIAEKRF